ncbi:MAG: DUF4058 family protein [Gemmataceae bacterium]|nr:DUF4058 family protein [Gemmataceae bacterium]MCI0743069.1 DUF4058 family protein [Gemmataceae bacterium]
MPSPFPGMNPYLEHEDPWHDFHEKFMPLASDLLVPQVRPEFIVKLDQHVYIHELSADERRFLGRPDLFVASPTPPTEQPGSTSVLEAPAEGVLPPTIDFEHHTFLEIRNRSDRSLVTILELLTPTNKAIGPDREQFLAKRRQILASSVHYVEIDLLRGGPRLPIQKLASCDYYVMVSRWNSRPKVDLWPLRLRDRLPEIPIPLRPSKPEARLDLQAMVNRLYDTGSYQDYIYAHEPTPPLHPEDAVWAQELIAQSKKPK